MSEPPYLSLCHNPITCDDTILCILSKNRRPNFNLAPLSRPTLPQCWDQSGQVLACTWRTTQLRLKLSLLPLCALVSLLRLLHLPSSSSPSSSSSLLSMLSLANPLSPARHAPSPPHPHPLVSFSEGNKVRAEPRPLPQCSRSLPKTSLPPPPFPLAALLFKEVR